MDYCKGMLYVCMVIMGQQGLQKRSSIGVNMNLLLAALRSVRSEQSRRRFIAILLSTHNLHRPSLHSFTHSGRRERKQANRFFFRSEAYVQRQLLVLIVARGREEWNCRRRVGGHDGCG